MLYCACGTQRKAENGSNALLLTWAVILLLLALLWWFNCSEISLYLEKHKHTFLYVAPKHKFTLTFLEDEF